MTVIEEFSRYDRIIVSGCQRSGTTAFSKMLAADLNYQLIDESDFGFHDASRFLQQLGLEKIVIQCPALSHLLHLIEAPKAVAVWMKRPFQDIRKSMERLGWWVAAEEPREKTKYANTFAGLYAYDASLPIERIKQELWDNYQKPRMKIAATELEYDCPYMRNHQMYVNAEKRSCFTAKQTE